MKNLILMKEKQDIMICTEITRNSYDLWTKIGKAI